MKKFGKQLIDDYIAAAPKEARTMLRQMRKLIQSTAPKAEEVISYGMPAYKYKGILVYFAAFKDHCSFFPGGKILKNFEKQAKPYQTSVGTLQFLFGEKLPMNFIKKIIKERVKENKARAALKRKRV